MQYMNLKTSFQILAGFYTPSYIFHDNQVERFNIQKIFQDSRTQDFKIAQK